MANFIRTQASITLFSQATSFMLRERGGPVGQYTKGVAEQVLVLAKGNIGTRYSGHHPERPLQLKDSGIVVPNSIDATGTSWSVLFDHEIAFIHHEGTRAHDIPFINGKTRGGKGGFYRATPEEFPSSGIPLRRTIKHRGTKANRYLVTAGRQAGLTVSSPALTGRTTIAANLRGFA